MFADEYPRFLQISELEPQPQRTNERVEAVGRVLVARPSVPALKLLVESYGFEIESAYDWRGRFADRPVPKGLQGYAGGKRVTWRCRSVEAARAAGLPPVAPFRLDAAVASGREPHAPALASPVGSNGGWRARVNKALARTIGYELRRATVRH